MTLSEPEESRQQQTCRCNCGYTCGGPGVCKLPRLECIQKHYVKDCDHEFTGWIEGTTDSGGAWGSTVCKRCGITAMQHDMISGP